MTDDTPSGGLEAFQAELDETFLRELAERLPEMADALATLERAPGSTPPGAALDQLARHAHSVKGGAMLVGRLQIARLAEALEARFDARRSSRSELPPTADLRASLEVIGRLAGKNPPDDTEVNRLVALINSGD